MRGWLFGMLAALTFRDTRPSQETSPGEPDQALITGVALARASAQNRPGL